MFGKSVENLLFFTPQGLELAYELFQAISFPLEETNSGLKFFGRSLFGVELFLKVLEGSLFGEELRFFLLAGSFVLVLYPLVFLLEDLLLLKDIMV